MFTGYLLSESSRQKLLSLFPPKYPEVVCHHVTEQFGVPVGTEAPEKPESVVVVGYVNDEVGGVEGLLVQVDGSVNRKKDGMYHITLSLDRSKGAKPFHTNRVIHAAESVEPVRVEVTPKVFQF